MLPAPLPSALFFDMDQTLVTLDGLIPGMEKVLIGLKNAASQPRCNILTSRCGIPLRASAQEIDLLEYFQGGALVAGDGIYDVATVLKAVKPLRPLVMAAEANPQADDGGAYGHFVTALQNVPHQRLSIASPMNKAELLQTAAPWLYSNSYMPDADHAVVIIGDALGQVYDDNAGNNPLFTGDILPFLFTEPCQIHARLKHFGLICANYEAYNPEAMARDFEEYERLAGENCTMSLANTTAELAQLLQPYAVGERLSAGFIAGR